PFWQASMLDTARAIEAGAPSLATLRPDLPKQLIRLVDCALSLSPTRRPSAAALADALRGAAAHRRRKRARAFGVSIPAEAGRAAPRRAAQAGLAVLVAAVVAGMRHASLPLVGSRPPLGLGIAGARDPFDVAGSLGRAAAAHPGLLVEACVFAVVALALPFAHARGRWGAAALGGT